MRGLPKNLSPETLKINLLGAVGDVYHVDTLDLYSAKGRGHYLTQAAKELKVREDVIKHDLGRILLKLEALQDERIKAATTKAPAVPAMSEAEREAALALLRAPGLLERIVADFDACGLAGERTNKLVGYLAAVSRKLDRPLAIVVQSSSAAGKSSLMYLAVVLDLFNREVIGWSLKPRMTTDLASDALTMAWFRRRPAPGVLHHSDRGSQYASLAYQEKLAEFGMTCSMSRKGNCWDNSPTESWFNSFKNERYHGVRYTTHAEMKAASFEYIEVFYIRKRQHSTLGYISPIQFLNRWISAQNQEKQAA